MCQAVGRKLYNPSKGCHVRKVAHLLAQALSPPYLRGVCSGLWCGLPRITLPKLFGNSGMVPNRGSESGQEGSEESRFGRLLSQERRAGTPAAIFQTVSPRNRVNRPKTRPSRGTVIRSPRPRHRATVFLRFLDPHHYSVPQTGHVQRCPRSWLSLDIHATLRSWTSPVGKWIV
jgi:hypothetical protein